MSDTLTILNWQTHYRNIFSGVIRVNSEELDSINPEQPELTRTQRLNLFWKKLENYPDLSDLLVNYIEILILADNQLEAIPPEFARLTMLRSCILTNNNLRMVPAELGQLTNLTNLSLADNLLRVIPPEYGRLDKLESLYLGKNRLVTIPAELGRLTNLKELDLERNLLKSLPSELGQLTNLEVLELEQNHIRILPKEVGQLFKLKTLNLGNNQLTVLPIELRNLTTLDVLIVDYNPLVDLSPQLSTLINNLINNGYFSMVCNHLKRIPLEYNVNGMGPLTVDWRLRVKHRSHRCRSGKQRAIRAKAKFQLAIVNNIEMQHLLDLPTLIKDEIFYHI